MQLSEIVDANSLIRFYTDEIKPHNADMKYEDVRLRKLNELALNQPFNIDPNLHHQIIVKPKFLEHTLLILEYIEHLTQHKLTRLCGNEHVTLNRLKPYRQLLMLLQLWHSQCTELLFHSPDLRLISLPTTKKQTDITHNICTLWRNIVNSLTFIKCYELQHSFFIQSQLLKLSRWPQARSILEKLHTLCQGLTPINVGISKKDSNRFSMEMGDKYLCSLPGLNDIALYDEQALPCTFANATANYIYLYRSYLPFRYFIWHMGNAKKTLTFPAHILIALGLIDFTANRAQENHSLIALNATKIELLKEYNLPLCAKPELLPLNALQGNAPPSLESERRRCLEGYAPCPMQIKRQRLQ